MGKVASKKKKPKKVTLRTDYSGKKFGPFVIKRYVEHINNSPQWEAECEYCNTLITGSISNIKSKKYCECEENMRWLGNIVIGNNILKEYFIKCKAEKAQWDLTIIDLYKIYIKQSKIDKNGNKLIFDYHWNYTNNPPTCNYIWPDLVRIDKSKPYTLSNCIMIANNIQRFTRVKK